MPTATLIKYGPEVRTYDFDFSLLPEIAGGDTLTGTPTLTATPTGLSFSAITIFSANQKVKFTISGGTAGQLYVVRCQVNTAAGETLIGEGELQLR